MKKVSVSVIVLFWFILFSHAGLGVLFFELDPYRVILGYVDKDTIFLITALSGVSFVLVALGIKFCRLFPYFQIVQPSYTVNWVSSPSIVHVLIALIVVFSIYVMSLYVGQLKSVPLFLLLGLADGSIESARSAAGNTFEGRFYLYNLILSGVLPFIAAVAFALYKERPTIFGFWFFLGILLVAMFGAVLLTSKSQFLNLLLVIFLTHLIMRGGAIKFGPIIIFSMLGILFLVVMMKFVFLQSQSYGIALASAISRILAEGHESYHYVQLFPYHLDYVAGRTLPNPSQVFPFENYRLSIEVQNYLRPEGIKSGIQGSAPTTYWGEYYANAGILGVLALSPILGFYLGIFDGVMSRITNSAIKSALLAWLCIHFAGLTGTFSSALLLDLDLIVIVTLSLFLMYAGNIPISSKRILSIK